MPGLYVPHTYIHLMMNHRAGMDTRAYTLDALAGCTVFEVDQTEVMELKEQLISTAPEEVILQAKALHRIRANFDAGLETDWLATMGDLGFDKSVPTVWVMEGLLYYLTVSGDHIYAFHIYERTLLQTLWH